MSTIEEIEHAVRQLSAEDLAEFRRWFAEFDSETFGRDLAGTEATDSRDALAVEALPAQREAAPLRRDGAGALRVGQSRVLLEIVIRAFQDGATPEAIAQRYPTATLADIYAVIAYYLRHREPVEAYLTEREHQAEEVRQRIENRQGDLTGVRDRLLARQQAAPK